MTLAIGPVSSSGASAGCGGGGTPTLVGMTQCPYVNQKIARHSLFADDSDSRNDLIFFLYFFFLSFDLGAQIRQLKMNNFFLYFNFCSY